MNTNLVLIVAALIVWVLLWLFRGRIVEFLDNITFHWRAPFLFRYYFKCWPTKRSELKKFQLRDVVWPGLRLGALELNSVYDEETEMLEGAKQKRLDYRECNKRLPKIKKRQESISNSFYTAKKVAVEMGFTNLARAESHTTFLAKESPDWLIG